MALQIIQDVISNLSFQDALVFLKPVGIFIISIAIYSWFIFKFYRFVARREIFEFNPSDEYRGFRKFIHTIGYGLKYILLFPLFTFFWFAILTIILSFLSRQTDINLIIIISVSLVTVIRVMAYYNEDLSKDLAKMLPFALLGVFLVDFSYFSVETTLSTLQQLPQLWRNMIYSLILIIVVEFLLRIIYSLSIAIRGKKETD